MNLCLNPNCLAVNTTEQKFCQKCGTKLLLQERYQAFKLIGQGGFGKTFLAKDEGKPSKPYCVIKQFFPIAQGTNNVEKAAELFQQEAIYLENLGKHPQIPELLSFFTQSEQQYLVQEYIQGNNLAQELQEKQVFTESEVRGILINILQILEFVHSHKVIHRDIKPENIIKRQSDGKLVLVDFGAAKQATKTALAVTGTVIGSAAYTAPEQAIGKPNFASDLYSLGVTCIELLTGIEPFELYSTLEGDWVWRDFLKNNPVGEQLGNILDKLIVQGLKKRYQSSTEVLEILTNTRERVKTVISHPVSPQSEQKNKSNPNLTINLGKGVTLDLVHIPGKSWLMGKYPVTQSQYEAVMGNNPSHFKGASRPVEKVSWDDAQEFCHKASILTGKQVRLPSEIEWEYAARAGTTTDYFFGNNAQDLDKYAWYSGNSNKQTQPVGMK